MKALEIALGVESYSKSYDKEQLVAKIMADQKL
jgi:hypothetical protein